MCERSSHHCEFHLSHFFCTKKGVEWIHHVLHLLLCFDYADRQGINSYVHVGTLTNGLNCNCLQITGREHQYWHRRAVGAQRQSMRGLSGLSRWRAPTSYLTNIYSLHINRKIIVLKNINSNISAASFTTGRPNCSLLWWVIRSGFVGLFSNECQKSVIFHWRIMDEKHNLCCRDQVVYSLIRPACCEGRINDHPRILHSSWSSAGKSINIQEKKYFVGSENYALCK